MPDFRKYLNLKCSGPCLIFISLLALPGCNETKIEARWARTPIRVDGKIADWKEYPTTFYKEENAAISLCNNSQNLYLHFRTNDKETAQLVKRSGLKIYLDNKGKKKKDFYICYKAGPAGFEMKGPGSRESGMSGGDRDSDKKERPDNATRDRTGKMTGDSSRIFTCYQKDVIIEKPIPVDGAEGPAAAYDTSLGFYAYEFLVPLTETKVRQYGLGAAPGQKICIGIEWGDMSDMKSLMKPSGGRGGMGGGPPGGGKGGGPGGDRGGMQMPEKQELWIKTVLAQPAVENTEASH